MNAQFGQQTQGLDGATPVVSRSSSTALPPEGQPLLGNQMSGDDGGIEFKPYDHQHFHMHLYPTVYTSILYAPAICRVKNKTEFGRGTRMALSLVTINMILQVGMLRIMDVYGHRDAEASFSGVIQPATVHETHAAAKEVHMAFLTPHEKKVLKEGSRSSLCTSFPNGTYNCLPPSLAFVDHWEELDTNHDGVWTLEEAMARQNNLTAGEDDLDASHRTEDARKWIVDRPTLVFSGIIHGLKQRAVFLKNMFNRTLYLPESFKNRSAISKAHFDYWTGDAMMCSRFDRQTCQNVVASGLFDAALTHGRMAAAYKGISNYDSATRYCQVMLEEGGGCEESLPVSYAENLQGRRSICGNVATSTRTGVEVMTNPHDDSETLPVMDITFTGLKEQERAVDVMFLFFKVLLMYLFYASLKEELRELIGTLEFLMCFPGVKNADDPGGEIIEFDGKLHDQEHKKYRIRAISRKHRAILWCVFVLRVTILVILLRFGSWFLLNEGRYIELVMNALALNFITGIDEMLYTFLETAEIKEDGFEDVKPVSFETMIPPTSTWRGYAFGKECWGLILIPIVAVMTVVCNAHFQRAPVIEAMHCSCLADGNTCAESMVHQKDWWQHYWSHTLPAAIHQIEAMRLQAQGA